MLWYLLVVLNASRPLADNGSISSQLIPMGSEAECNDRMKALDASKIVFKEARGVEVRAVCIKGFRH